MAEGDSNDATASGAPFRWSLRALALVALVISAYLSYSIIVDRPVAGCGDGAVMDCNSVLASRWAKWLDVPVSFAAVAVYGCVLAAAGFIGPRVPSRIARLAWMLLVGLSTMAAGSALWFLALQMFSVGSLCVYCIGAHLAGICVAALVLGRCFASRTALQSPMSIVMPAVAGAVLVAVLIVGQLLYESQGYQVEIAEGGNDDSQGERVVHKPVIDDPPENGTDKKNGTPQPSRSRIVKFHKGQVTVDTWRRPILGSPEAPKVIVKLFDYTCPGCRARHKQLEELRAHYGDQLAIVMLPTPLNPACNRHARGTSKTHQDACVYARLALAVWRIAPEKFEPFHHWLFEPPQPPSPREARAHAAELVGKSALDAELDDVPILELLNECVAAYGAVKAKRIPMVLVGDAKITGRFKDADELRKVLEKYLPAAKQ